MPLLTPTLLLFKSIATDMDGTSTVLNKQIIEGYKEHTNEQFLLQNQNNETR